MALSYHAMPTQKPRDLRPFVYGVLDLLFAFLYLVIATQVARTATGQFEVASVVLAVAVAAAGVGTLLRSRTGWWVALAGCAILLVGAVMLLTLLCLSAAFLHGVYGSMGRAASAVTLAIAFVALELYLLLPAFQLRYLLSAAGRQAAGR
jgi:hypothetical protein